MNLEKIRERIVRKKEERFASLERKRNALLQKLRDGLPDFRKEFPEVAKVVVFGSLVHPGYFTEISDANLPNLRYWETLLWLEKRLAFEDIDLVRIEDARPAILKFIEMGVVLYEN